VPLLRMVTVCGALVVPRSAEAKMTVEADNVIAGTPAGGDVVVPAPVPPAPLLTLTPPPWRP
jgi:hypothetical protein